MTLIILLSVLIACAIFITTFIVIQAKKVSDFYVYNNEFRDTDENKSPFVHIQDDKGFEIIINFNTIQMITKSNVLKEFLINIWLVNDVNPEPIVLHYEEEMNREVVFNKLYDYTLNE